MVAIGASEPVFKVLETPITWSQRCPLLTIAKPVNVAELLRLALRHIHNQTRSLVGS